ncbi:glycosyltransferase [Saccharopolyspora hordei]|uniref:UDP:flavonoid glycosyltransferase YjiC (YdhE family) n=1 Tax=Saccharopolyspora hordei TaxID=1838 RepID=A0A853AIZ1_9PSEU|nr:UDP:flavonoid glycosyltransferase YjiC (YdhE family) [Saccharopolyspora hordei]
MALGVPVREVGNRVSWSTRDGGFGRRFDEDTAMSRPLRARLGIPDGAPEVVARIDPRPPSTGGLSGDEVDEADGVPWWPMRFVPLHGGCAVPAWALQRPERPRIGVTLGTVVPTTAGTSTASVVVEALGDLDVDVVPTGREPDLADVAPLPDNARAVGFPPLSAFLPISALLVHHGGSGTTAAALHHGVPQLLLPSFADDAMSAERGVDRGVGPAHDPATVDAELVRSAVRALLDDPAFAEAAREVSAEMATQPSPAPVLEGAISQRVG